MLRTMDSDKIQNCEIEYYKCFCKSYQTQTFERFSDDLLKDMYYHNFSLIKTSESDVDLYHHIKEEILFRRAEGGNFCNILSFAPISDCLIGLFEIEPEISINGFYLFDITKLTELNGKENCIVSKVDSLRMADDILRLGLEHDGTSLGVDFCTRRVNRRKQVYLSAEGVDSYICYDNDEAVGNCDLFMYKDAAKIEDFAVSPRKQRQGYGTAILKSLIEIALSKGVSTIFLVTDEGDTAKEMYLKSGFYKIGERKDLLFRL